VQGRALEVEDVHAGFLTLCSCSILVFVCVHGLAFFALGLVLISLSGLLALDCVDCLWESALSYQVTM
jgi:hypothetical protein